MSWLVFEMRWKLGFLSQVSRRNKESLKAIAVIEKTFIFSIIKQSLV